MQLCTKKKILSINVHKKIHNEQTTTTKHYLITKWYRIHRLNVTMMFYHISYF